jgi:hypothetical protein
VKNKNFVNHFIVSFLSTVTYVTLVTQASAADSITVDIESLRPGQSAIGYAESAMRGHAIAKMDQAEREEYLEKHTMEVVAGPGERLHLVDGHHLAYTLLDLESRGVLEAKAPATVIADLSDLNEDEFWKTMIEKKWVFLLDRNDRQISAKDLPTSIRNLQDDPHRTLAWLLREEECYEKLEIPFQDFTWTKYLRGKIELTNNKPSSIRKALLAAKKLAHSRELADFPGFVSKHKAKDHDKLTKKAEKRLKSLEQEVYAD